MQVSCLACCSDIKTVSVIPGKRLKTTKRGNLTIAIRQIEAFALPFEVGWQHRSPRNIYQYALGRLHAHA